ncbi:hypothetical protein EZV62_016076 [Acer yangbiense]|uniref:Replication protein A 14 kDa subunit B n=2 Tax=Acer TaxID=4022 RepID=A0A5C7HMI1_9ROSI|nr:hypothetical protein EZV62_016076 [Acer yangbiense]
MPCTVLQDMDTSNPAVFVNGGLLRMYVGRRVRAVIQAIQPDAGGVTGKSTDDHQLVVKGSPPPFRLTNFVEVIGIADSDRSIRAETWTNFGDTFDTQNYNQLCQLANGEFKHLFI